MDNSQTKVNFVIGGTQKGGTSALDVFLRQHPKICMAETCKEVHYFDQEKHFAGQPDYRKYHAFFRPGPQHCAIGDATPIYMYWDAAPIRIKSYNPRMKWILALRNPVERAFSAWNMETKRQAERLPFKAAVEQEASRCREARPLQHRVYSYLDRGFYARQVRRIHELFGQENCLVILNEDLQNDHSRTLQTVLRFLGVDETIIPTASKVNLHPYEEKIEPELQARLTDLFRADIRELEQLIQRDLSAWHSPALISPQITWSSVRPCFCSCSCPSS
jgi:hypothetical protein